MGKGGRNKRKRQQNRKRRMQVAGAAPAPNLAGAQVDAVRHAVALITAFHASPDDLPDLLGELVTDPVSQGLVANALHSRFIVQCCSDIAEAHGTRIAVALGQLLSTLPIEEASNRDVWDQAVGTARIYADVLDGARPPEEFAEALGAQLGRGLNTISYLIVLVQLAHHSIEARCAEFGENVADYLRTMSLPVAEAHGNEIDADSVDEYMIALIDDRLAAEPQLLSQAAQAFSQGAVTMPDELAGEFDELGGADRLAELVGATWDDLDDDDDRRLVFMSLLDAVYINPDGDKVADRLRVNWRF